MPLDRLPSWPYGAVYFRKSNPPRQDWANDYATAAEDGMNAFRHWVLWSAIEVAPGVYDWADYDEQLDLAAEHGIKTILAEMITSAPEWAYRAFPDARLETRDGRKVASRMSGSCVIGGFPGLCLDNAEYAAAARAFLTSLVQRYRGHPGLAGYDLWNECNYAADTCYCPATADAFCRWLEERYGDLDAVGEAWHRPSFASWDDISPPRDIGPYPHVMDWLCFRSDNAYRWLSWRHDIVRGIDPDCAIVGHGLAGSTELAAHRGADDWRAASHVEAYGYTWGSSRHGDEPWKQFHAVDLVRAASRGKPFWHAEAYGGPLWMQPNVLGKPRDEGRIASPEDIRYWNLVSAMCGARGLFFLRWRPLLDGPLFGAFGPYGMDGSRTPRSEMAREVGKWIASQEESGFWQSRPVQGELGIVYVPEAQRFCYAQQGTTEYYAQSMRGAYQAFFDLNIQADWVHIEDIHTYSVLYLPFPTMLGDTTVERLKEWVRGGGTLVIEGCPAYWDERAHVGTSQPNLGLDELLGCRENYVEFTPDLLGDLRVRLGSVWGWGSIYLQAYLPTTGHAEGWYDDGQIAAVSHDAGQGRTLVVGTMLGAGYAAHIDSPRPELFQRILDWASVEPRVLCSDPAVKVRIQDGEGGATLWLANPTRLSRPVSVRLGGAWAAYGAAETLRGNPATTTRRGIALEARARDVTVVRLEPSGPAGPDVPGKG